MIKLIDIYNEYGNDTYIWKGDSWMPLEEGYCKEYDLKVEEDMLFGKLGEKFTEQLFEGNTKIEIKTERDMWKKTGNIAIEIRYKGQPSGISTTESSVWMHYLTENGVIIGGFLFKVDQLRAKIKKLHKEGSLNIVMGGDDNLSQMALLPINTLFESNQSQQSYL